MALEPAGISLEAQNFNKYIKQLDTIDKAQQDIFDVDSRKVTKSFNDASKAADKYEKELKQVEQANKRAAQSQAQFSQGLAAATTGLVAFATGAVVQFGAESAKLAAQFQGQQTGLNNLAAAAGQSGSKIQAAIQSASKGTISGLNAITAANQGLLFGVAKTPDEFAKLTSIATTLGRTLGLEATQSVEEFTLALGRGSTEILDNFGVSAKQVNAEIERLAQADFGKARSELTEAQKQATFLKAALNIAGQAAATIGDEAGKAQEAFDRLSAQSENLKVTFGALVQPLGAGIAEALARAAKTAQQFFAFLGAGFAGVGTIARGIFAEMSIAFSRLGQLIKGEISFAEFNQPLREFSDILDEAGINATNRFKEIASTIEGVSFPNDEAKEFAKNLGEQGEAAEEAAINLKAYQTVLEQAENLQLSFARAAEDSALKLARANEDIARKQAQSVAKLEERQAKDRDKLLKDQIKQREKFEADSKKQIARAEEEISKERKKAGEERKRDQRKLQQDLLRAQEQFNLSQLQSQRRFDLQESRLRAEGDILGLKELREDFALSQQEEKENFDLSKKEQVRSGKEQQKEAQKASEDRVKELKESLEQQRVDLLSSFDEQLRNQQIAQAEARAEQQRAFDEAAAERSIQLAREEEDRRISQARQLEDLGRSFAEQEGVTVEGTTAIAAQLEKVFGIDGTADSIITGFTTKTKSEFTDLFADLEDIVKKADIEPDPIPVSTTRQAIGSGGFGGRIGGVSEFNDGGVVPGPVGAPVPAIVHGGETVLPTHRQSFQMAAPAIPSQNLNVNMSGGFNVSGDGQGDERILQAAAAEMTENFRIAVQRIARRN